MVEINLGHVVMSPILPAQPLFLCYACTRTACETLINEEALVFAKYLISEIGDWKP